MRSGISLIQAGLAVFVVTGLMATLVEGGDCGGSATDCDAAFAASQTRVRVLAVLLVGLAGLAVFAWQSRRWVAQAILLGAASVVLVAGLSSLVLRSSMPGWLPFIALTSPGAALLMAGAYVRLLATRAARASD
jgi:hypothetical protein